MTSKLSNKQRRTPRQTRSRAACEAIVEAAAQILERGGPAALTTAAVAERAGVSIGTLYQYFPDKQAILVAAARRQIASQPLQGRAAALVQALIAAVERMGGLVAAPPGAPPQGPDRRRRRRGPAWERRIAEALGALVDLLAAPPRPALRLAPIRPQRPGQGPGRPR